MFSIEDLLNSKHLLILKKSVFKEQNITIKLVDLARRLRIITYITVTIKQTKVIDKKNCTCFIFVNLETLRRRNSKAVVVANLAEEDRNLVAVAEEDRNLANKRSLKLELVLVCKKCSTCNRRRIR